MSAGLECVFLPPKFAVSDILSIIYYSDSPDHAPSISISVGKETFSFPFPNFAEGRFRWSFSSIPRLTQLTASRFTLNATPDLPSPARFDLARLCFFGRSEYVTPRTKVFYLEFLSGLYLRFEDHKSTTVLWPRGIASLTPCSLAAATQIDSQLTAYADAQAEFSAAQADLEISELSRLRDEYISLYSRIEELQVQFHQSTTDEQVRQDDDRRHGHILEARRSLTRHLQQTGQYPVSYSHQATQEGWIARRYASLAELKELFAGLEDGNCLGVKYSTIPLRDGLDATRTFLGFATHFVKEVARILGIALPFSLVPAGASSRIEKTLIDTTIPLLPTDRDFKQYEKALVECCNYLRESLNLSVTNRETLLEAIKAIGAISERDLHALLPQET
jgi:hypothetical protein